MDKEYPMSWFGDFIGKLLQAAADWVSRCIPEYNPHVWNDNPWVQNNNNCYNYGCDLQTNTFAQPGRAHGILLAWPQDMNCAAVTNGAVADGLVPVNCDEGCGCSDCQHQVALVISPASDYHWYRKQKEGFWGHKPGHTPAKNTDNNGAIVWNPETCARAPYTNFCGYFYVPKSQKIN